VTEAKNPLFSDTGYEIENPDPLIVSAGERDLVIGSEIILLCLINYLR